MARTFGQAAPALRMSILLIGLFLMAAIPVAAGGTERRMLDDMEAVAFRGVGRLNIAGSRFCTATLISDRLVLTAAHCLYHPETSRRVGVEEFRFVAGQRRDTIAAVRSVARAVTLPAYVFDGAPRYGDVRQDLALIELSEPVAADAVLPFDVGARGPGGGAVSIVSYARDRPQASSIQEVCPVQIALAGVAVLRCAVDFGASGAPVFEVANGRLRLVAVVSAMGRDVSGQDVALSVLAAPRLPDLLAELAGDKEE